MKKNDSQPLNKNFICSNELEDQQTSSKDFVPIFLLPYGFNSLSLFQIAQYYDGSAANFFKNIIFTSEFNENSDIQHDDFSKYKICDYSYYFHQIMQNFQIPKTIQSPQYIKLCDRYFDIDFFLSLPPLGDLSYLSYHIPKGKEDGIVYILSQTREFLRPHLFSLMSVPFSTLSAKVTITIGQPFLLNKILSSTYSNVDSVNSRKESLINDMNNLKFHEYQIDWAIVSFNGFSSLILVRPPQYLRISDRKLEEFNTIDKAFENSNVYLVCYRHSQFINYVHFEKSDATPKIERPLKSDSFFCNLLKDEMKRKFIEKCQNDFESYLIYSLRFPSFYLMNCGFEKEIAMAASVVVDDPTGKSVPLFLPLLLKSINKNAESASKKKILGPDADGPAPASTDFDGSPSSLKSGSTKDSKLDSENIENSSQSDENKEIQEEENENEENQEEENENEENQEEENENEKENSENSENQSNENKDDLVEEEKNENKNIENKDENKENTESIENKENNENKNENVNSENKENSESIENKNENVNSENNENTENKENSENVNAFTENENLNDAEDDGVGSVLVSPFQNQEEVESKLLSSQSTQIKIAVQEYFKFCFWLRSFITVLKFICKRDLNGVAESSLSCFRSLPLRNRRVVVSTILLLTESLKKFRKMRGQNDDFYQKVLRIFKSLFGEEFDQVLGLQKWEVPRDMRNQVVCVDNCVKMFYVRSFKSEKISINNLIYRLTKYMDPVMKEISFDQEVPNFKFCQSYIDFLRLQKFDKIVEI